MKATPEQIRQFGYVLRDIIMVSLRAAPEEVNFGHPCSHLIDAVTTRGLDTVATEILNGAGEWRVNGAGLKLWTELNRDGKVWAKLGGDQYDYYPKTGPAINSILKSKRYHE